VHWTTPTVVGQALRPKVTRTTRAPVRNWRQVSRGVSDVVNLEGQSEDCLGLPVVGSLESFLDREEERFLDL